MAYAGIVAGGSASSSTESEGIGNEKMAEYENAYAEKSEELGKLTADDFKTFWSYHDKIKAYNETSANEDGLKTEDLLKGDGKKLESGDKDYLAYYVGWCADESIFDSSLDDDANPTAFVSALDPSQGLIAGWESGVVGMRLGGVRIITVPSELAYGEDSEICGGTNKPLKFMIMAVANEDPLKTLAKEVSTAYMKLYYASYGIDYDAEYGGSSD